MKAVTLPKATERERDPKRPHPAKETVMNAIVSSLYRDLTCAAAAVLISVLVSMSFLQSTATAPGPTVNAHVANA